MSLVSKCFHYIFIHCVYKHKDQQKTLYILLGSKKKLFALQTMFSAAVRTPPEHMRRSNMKHSHIADYLTIVRLCHMWHSF